MKKKPLAKQDNDDNSLPADLLYSPKDDIYNKGKREENIDPDDQSVIDSTREVEGKGNEKDFNEDKSGDDLDIPGAELDDPDEKVGGEDEENNYYSLGGDNHNDLEEDKGE